jgi:hypothetical protein
MKSFEFEIQELIKVVIEARDVEQARNIICTRIEMGEIEFKDPYVSDGKEVNN